MIHLVKRYTFNKTLPLIKPICCAVPENCPKVAASSRLCHFFPVFFEYSNVQILATSPVFSCANYFNILRWRLSRPPGFSSSIAGNFTFNIELYLLNSFYHFFLLTQFISSNFCIPVMQINPPGFSHANYIVFLIIQQGFPIPLAFNYILTRCFSLVSFSGQKPTVNHICLLSHGGREEGLCSTALHLWQCMASSCLSTSWIYSFLQDTPLLFSGSFSNVHLMSTFMAHFDASLHTI